MHQIIGFLFFAAVLLAGVLGTETRLLFFWPAGVLLGLAGILQVAGPRLRVPFPPSDACLGTALLAAAYFGGRAALSPVVDHAREDFFILCAGLIAYVLMATLGARPGGKRWFWRMLVLLAIGNLVVGTIHFGGDWSFHVVPRFVRSFEEGRIGGFYNNPNHLAAFFSLIVFLGLAQLCLGRGGATARLLTAFLVVVSMLGMALTVSRGALLGLAAGGVVFAGAGFFLVRRTRPYLLGRLAGGVVLLSLVVGGVLWKVNEDYLRRRSAEQSGVQDARFPIWKAALAQHADQPWTGVGARMFYEGSVRHRQPDLPRWLGEAEFAHNEYLQTLADYGWVGFAVLGLAVLVHARNGARFLKWFVEERFPQGGTLASGQLAFAVGTLSALAASLAHALVEFHWHVGGLVVLSGSLMGVLANPGFEGAAWRPRRLPMVRPMLKLAVLTAGVCLVAGGFWWGRSDWLQARAVLAGEGRDPVEAVRLMEAAVELDRAGAAKAFLLAQYRLDLAGSIENQEERKRLIEAARVELERSAGLNPFSHVTASALADVYFVLNQQERALAEIHRAMALAPLYEEPRLALGLYHHRRRAFQEAERAYLWAATACAGNLEENVNWLVAYRQLLMDAGSLKRPEADVESPAAGSEKMDRP